MSDMRLDTKGRRPHFFNDPAVDAVMTALLETMSENWALREEVTALRHLLQDKGVITAEENAAYALSAEAKQTLAAQQQEFLHDAFRALNADVRSRADIQKEIDAD